MNKVLIIMRVLLGAGLLMASSAGATTTYYSNQTAWTSTVTGITTETYESYTWNYSGGDYLYNNPSVALGGITYSFPGNIYGINSTVKTNDAPYLSGKYLLWQNSPDLITVTLPNPVNAIAFKYGDFFGGSRNLSVSLGNGDSTTVGTLSNSYAFFGAVSDTAFTSFSLNAGNNFLIIDDLSRAATPTPIPGALVLFGSGLIGLVGIGRKRIWNSNSSIKSIKENSMKNMLIAAILSAAMILSTTSADATSVLLHQYNFQNGVTDQVGSANGTLMGGATVSGGNLTLDGVNDYVQFPTLIIPSSGSYSVALRVQELTHFNRYVEFISQGVQSGSSFYIGYDPNGIMRLGDSYMNTGVPYPTGGEYHMYVAVVDADSTTPTTKLYIDGVLRATKNSAITSNPDPSGSTRLGQQFHTIWGEYNEYFAGNIDDVSIYSGALSASEVGILNVTPTPIPGALVLFGSGLLGLVGIGRKRFKK